PLRCHQGRPRLIGRRRFHAVRATAHIGGWFAVGFPKEWSGQGSGIVGLVLTAEQLGRSAAPSSAWMALSTVAVPALAAAPPMIAAHVLEGGVCGCRCGCRQNFWAPWAGFGWKTAC